LEDGDLLGFSVFALDEVAELWVLMLGELGGLFRGGVEAVLFVSEAEVGAIGAAGSGVWGVGLELGVHFMGYLYY
jgi:hypothetical protein